MATRKALLAQLEKAKTPADVRAIEQKLAVLDQHQ